MSMSKCLRIQRTEDMVKKLQEHDMGAPLDRKQRHTHIETSKYLQHCLMTRPCHKNYLTARMPKDGQTNLDFCKVCRLAAQQKLACITPFPLCREVF